MKKYMSFGKVAGSEATHAVAEFEGKPDFKETVCDPGTPTVISTNGLKDRVTCQKCLATLKEGAWEKFENVDEFRNDGTVVFKEVTENVSTKAEQPEKKERKAAEGTRQSTLGNYRVRIATMSDQIDQVITDMVGKGQVPTVEKVKAITNAKDSYVKSYLGWLVSHGCVAKPKKADEVPKVVETGKGKKKDAPEAGATATASSSSSPATRVHPEGRLPGSLPGPPE